MKKILLITGLGLLVLLLVGVLAVTFFLDGAIKTGVETFGPKLTQTTVKLDNVSLSLLSGGGGIKGFVIGNPEGYKAPQAISVGSASLLLKPGSLLSDKIVIRSIRVEAPEITLEAGLGGNNFSKILANIDAATGGAKTNTAPETKTAPAEPKPGKKLQVDEFVINGAKLHFSITGLGGNALTLPLPPIVLTDLGQSPEGITGAELTKRVLTAIEQASLKAASDSGFDLSKAADKLTKDLTKQLGTNSTQEINKLGKSLGDLFKKK